MFLQVVRLLLDAAANVNAADRGLQTPLHKAAINGHAAVVEQLIARGARLNAVTIGGSTALHNASKWGHAGTVACLLARGADTSIQDKEFRTALDVATEAEHTNVVKLLVAVGDRAATSFDGLKAGTGLHTATHARVASVSVNTAHRRAQNRKSVTLSRGASESEPYDSDSVASERDGRASKEAHLQPLVSLQTAAGASEVGGSSETADSVGTLGSLDGMKSVATPHGVSIATPPAADESSGLPLSGSKAYVSFIKLQANSYVTPIETGTRPPN